ncbi:hypothetical protein AKG34_12665 [Peribacillus butanolivorans]|nr:hypothetical protein AKG34_12665 [Peribacillus butanolivorans]
MSCVLKVLLLSNFRRILFLDLETLIFRKSHKACFRNTKTITVSHYFPIVIELIIFLIKGNK